MSTDERTVGPDDREPETAFGNRRTATSLRERVAANPQPAIVWASVMALLVSVEFGALAHYLTTLTRDMLLAIPWAPDSVVDAAKWLASATGDIPTLLSRETIPNDGYWNGERFRGTFLGLAPHLAWLVRVTAIYVYSFAVAVWTWVGYDWYREQYRAADWTPRDDVIDRLRDHYWGLFGIVVVFLFVVMAVFAPALGPTTVQDNIVNPYAPQNEFKYWDAKDNEVDTAIVGIANQDSTSVGTESNVGIWSYDSYGRFHPFGTMPSGYDLFTFLMAGTRISLLIGLLAVGLSSLVALVLALVSAYYRGRVDLGIVLVSDSVMAMPQLMLLIMLSVILSGTWLGNIYDGGFVLALIFAGTGWPLMWRAIRGPSLQVAQRDWIDAAKSYGQKPTTIMRKHMLPYVTGYLLIYGSMTLGGAIIAIAGLSYLGLGVNPGTPEWGRAIKEGQPYVDTQSWHISLVPGLMITILVTGVNAFGDGIRDAIDPEAQSAEGEEASRGGGA